MRRFPLVSLALAAVLLAGIAGPAFASAASDARKQAAALKSTADKSSGEAKAAAQQQLEAFCKEKSDALKGTKLTRMDRAYLGMIQSYGGLHDEAIATLRMAVADKTPSKYEDFFASALVEALAAKGEWGETMVELEKMATNHAGSKRLKSVALKVGMAARKAGKHPEAARGLKVAVDARQMAALKPLVNSYLLANNKQAALDVLDAALEKAADHQKGSIQTLRDITAKIGSKVTVEFAAFAPGPGPDVSGKMLVLGSWNISSRSMKWVLQVIDAVNARYGEHGVTGLAVSTYYKKNAETGKIEEGFTPEQEHGQGIKVRDQWGLSTQLAFVKSEADLKALGQTALPYFVVIDKDGTLLFAHTMDRSRASNDGDILFGVIEKALGK